MGTIRDIVIEFAALITLACVYNALFVFQYGLAASTLLDDFLGRNIKLDGFRAVNLHFSWAFLPAREKKKGVSPQLHAHRRIVYTFSALSRAFLASLCLKVHHGQAQRRKWA